MKQKNEFSSGEEHRPAAHQQTQPQTTREFASAEELLRYDAKHTRVPPAVASRLQKSIGSTPAPARSWWRRIFGGSNP